MTISVSQILKSKFGCQPSCPSCGNKMLLTKINEIPYWHCVCDKMVHHKLKEPMFAYIFAIALFLSMPALLFSKWLFVFLLFPFGLVFGEIHYTQHRWNVLYEKYHS
jgi:hypothetical protein